MSWDYSECCTQYAESIEYLRNSLGIAQVDLDLSRQNLLPYQVVILQYINRQLIELGSDDLKTKIQKIFDIYEQGADLICNCTVPELAELIGVDTQDQDYRCCVFVFAWTNFLTALCIRLKFQYAYLFAPDIDEECCKCGARGETFRDMESWVSNVFPNDELYDRTNYTRTNSAWQVSKNRYCDCYRHSSTDDSNDSSNIVP